MLSKPDVESSDGRYCLDQFRGSAGRGWRSDIPCGSDDGVPEAACTGLPSDRARSAGTSACLCRCRDRDAACPPEASCRRAAFARLVRAWPHASGHPRNRRRPASAGARNRGRSPSPSCCGRRRSIYPRAHAHPPRSAQLDSTRLQLAAAEPPADEAQRERLALSAASLGPARTRATEIVAKHATTSTFFFMGCFASQTDRFATGTASKL